MKKTTRKQLGITSIFLGLLLSATFLFLVLKPKKTIYVSMLVNSGVWWGSEDNPPLWYSNAIKENLTNKSAKIIKVYRFPKIQDIGNKYTITTFVQLRLKAAQNPFTNEYFYKNQPILISKPLYINLPRLHLRGVVSEISEQPIKKNFKEKTLYITKKQAFPWEYEEIKVGDRYISNNQVIFQVINKEGKPTTKIVSDQYGNISPNTKINTYFLRLKIKVLAKEENGTFVFGTIPLIKNTPFKFTTNNFNYDGFAIEKITNQ